MTLKDPLSQKEAQTEELNALYREIIVEHAKYPRFKNKNALCQFCQDGKNPLCGDFITVYCKLSEEKGQRNLSFSFDGHGCFISQASASIMCESLQKVSLAETKKMLVHAENVYTGKLDLTGHDLEHDLEALYGVSKFPVRVKCAALPWKTLELLLEENFDQNGAPKAGCDGTLNCAKSLLNQRKLKIVSTENDTN